MSEKTALILLGLLVALPLSLSAQARKDRPLPEFSPQPYAVLKDSLKGWSYSLDGQWLSEPSTIPPRGVSQNLPFYEEPENQLGLDNIFRLEAYQVKFGRDTLVCLVKIYRQGTYKYPTRKKGWDEFLNAYYFLVPLEDLKQLKALPPNEVQVVRIVALAGGKLQDIDMRRIREEIKARLVIKDNYDRNLVVTWQYLSEAKKLRFQICSLHDIFPDVEGVRQDFTRRGRSVYGSVALFDYLYYETDYYQFLPLLEGPLANQEIRED